MKRLSRSPGIVTPFLAGLVILAGSGILYVQDLRRLEAGVVAQARLLDVQSELAVVRRGLPGPGGGAAEALAPHLDALGDLLAGNDDAGAALAGLRQALATPGAAPAALATPLDALQAAVTADRNADITALEGVRARLWQRLWLLLGLGGILLLWAGAVMLRELQARTRLDERLRYESTHDSLTGLPNRGFFLQWSSRALARARREHAGLALLYIDLDGLRRVNEEEGQEIGDRLLRVAATRFRERVRESDVLARFGSDDFVVLTPVSGEPESVAALAERLLEALAAPLLPQFGERYRVSASIGIAIYPREAQSAEGLVQVAEAAMRAARHAGGNRFHFAGAAAPASLT